MLSVQERPGNNSPGKRDSENLFCHENFVMKILKPADVKADKLKLSVESKIFITLVRSL